MSYAKQKISVTLDKLLRLGKGQIHLAFFGSF